MKRLFSRQPENKKAQAMVEFMLVLPLLVLLLYGIIELSRLIFIFASVANASRQAARYGAVAGETENGYYYQDCEGIRDVANRSAIIVDFDEINITYDRGITGDGTQIQISDEIDPSPDENTCPIEDNIIRNGDRIIVQVSADYEPIITLLPIDPFTVVSASARTFLISVPIAGSAMPLAFAAESATPSRVPTDTPPGAEEPTETTIPSSTVAPSTPGGVGGITPPAGVATNTQPVPTNPSNGSPLPPTLTFTPTKTPLPTLTPSITPTAISCTGQTGVSHGPLFIKENVMAMRIDNRTGYTLFITQVYVEWNHDKGHLSNNDARLRLQQITLASQGWTGDIYSPSAYIPAYYPSLPPGESVIEFSFDQNYTQEDGTERIILSLGTPGCVNYPIDSSR